MSEISLEDVYKEDARYFEEHPDRDCGIRLPHPEEFPLGELSGYAVMVVKLGEGISGRFLVRSA
jgi:hypothetical protein